MSTPQRPPKPSGDTSHLMHSAYLDIETSYRGEITVVGIFRPGRATLQLVGREITPVNVLDALGEARILKTYNGARFDLPVIRSRIGLDLKALYPHEDLMHQCWRHALKGGLKAVERQLGLSRETAGVDGLQAMALWARWETLADREALSRLLQYNRDDVEQLHRVERCLLEKESQFGKTF